MSSDRSFLPSLYRGYKGEKEREREREKECDIRMRLQALTAPPICHN